MSYTLPSDEALLEEHDKAFATRLGDSSFEWPLNGCRAVARLAIDHYRAELVKASGVDVEALAESCCDCEGVVHYDGCWVPLHFDRVADAIRTAIAQAVAQERERIAQAVADMDPIYVVRDDTDVEDACLVQIRVVAAIREGADRE